MSTIQTKIMKLLELHFDRGPLNKTRPQYLLTVLEFPYQKFN